MSCWVFTAIARERQCRAHETASRTNAVPAPERWYAGWTANRCRNEAEPLRPEIAMPTTCPPAVATRMRELGVARAASNSPLASSPQPGGKADASTRARSGSSIA